MGIMPKNEKYCGANIPRIIPGTDGLPLGRPGSIAEILILQQQ